jgi:flagellar M-ring protein FliF
MNSGITHTGPDPNRPQGGENNIYLTSMRLYERSYKSKILERLVPMYPGIAVGVSVELDPELYQTTYSTDFKGKPVAVDRKTLEKETPMAMASNGGRPGTFPNAIGNSSQQVASATTTERATETRTEERLINSQQRLESQKAGLVPKTVKASIDVPMSYLSKVWREANPKADKDTAPADDDLKKLESDARKRIEAAMVGVLPQTKGADGSSLVSISFSPDLTPEPLAQPSMTDTATSWLAGNWQSIGMLGLGLVALLFLKGLAKPTPVDTEPGATATRDESASAPGPQLRVVSASEDAAAEAAKTARQKRSFRGTGPNLRAELTELVKEDPETAANILRNWIGDVA